MTEKIGSIALMREMNKGKKLTFPIRTLSTIRNNVTMLNAIHFQEGKRWKSESSKKDGVVIVERVE